MEDRKEEDKEDKEEIPMDHGSLGITNNLELSTTNHGTKEPSTRYHGIVGSNGGSVTGTGEVVTLVALPEWPEGLTPPQVRFLNAYALGGSISQACRSCDMGRQNPYRWLDRSEVFREQFEVSKEYGVQRLEDWALARAMDAMNPSDRLTEFLLKAARPEVYRERVDHHLHGKVEHRKRVILESLDQARVVEALPEALGESTEEDEGTAADL